MANYAGMTGDKRLDSRVQSLWDSMCMQPGSTISKLSSTRAEQVAYYRLLENKKLAEDDLISELTGRMKPLATGRDLLCIEDSSEINVSENKNRLRANSGLGRSDNADNATCFKIHPGLVLDATNFNPLGFSAVKVFHRNEQRPDRFERNYKRQPINKKESYKWIEVSKMSKTTLAQANSITFIQDREGDIYEQFALIPDQKHHLLIRSRTTRNLWEGSDLYTEMKELPVAAVYTIEIPTDKRKNKYKRTAQMAVGYSTFRIKRPANLSKADYPEYLTVQGVWAQEITTGIDEKDLVNWKLLTTHSINDAIDALRMIEPVEEVFTESEIEVLAYLNKTLQGKTHKTQNLNNASKTKWASWIIGRLGGWKGYDSQGPPGVICLKKGLDRFNNILEGIKIAKDMCTG